MNDSYSQKSKLLSVKVEYEYFATESFEKIDCGYFSSSFKKSIKIMIFKKKEHLDTIKVLTKRFLLKEENLDVRGVITLNYQNKKIRYCFDRFGYFEKNGTTYKNDKLFAFLEKNIKFW